MAMINVMCVINLTRFANLNPFQNEMHQRCTLTLYDNVIKEPAIWPRCVHTFVNSNNKNIFYYLHFGKEMKSDINLFATKIWTKNIKSILIDRKQIYSHIYGFSIFPFTS